MGRRTDHNHAAGPATPVTTVRCSGDTRRTLHGPRFRLGDADVGFRQPRTISESFRAGRVGEPPCAMVAVHRLRSPTSRSVAARMYGTRDHLVLTMCPPQAVRPGPGSRPMMRCSCSECQPADSFRELAGLIALGEGRHGHLIVDGDRLASSGPVQPRTRRRGRVARPRGARLPGTAAPCR